MIVRSVCDQPLLFTKEIVGTIRLPLATRSVNKSYRTCDACRTTAVLSYVRPAFVNSYPVHQVNPCGVNSTLRRIQWGKTVRAFRASATSPCPGASSPSKVALPPTYADTIWRGIRLNPARYPMRRSVSMGPATLPNPRHAAQALQIAWQRNQIRHINPS